jgi:UDP-glucose 4-epimerase
MNNILITGGLGYIGSHASLEFSKHFKNIYIVDNLSNSSIKIYHSLEKLSDQNISFYEGDICDANFLHDFFQNHHIDLVVHFAALKSVPESIRDPFNYYRNNVAGTLNLLNIMKQFGVKYFLFSSSASIYSKDNNFPVSETAQLGFINPYAESKLYCEILLKRLHEDYQHMAFGILRYFNPLGNHSSGQLGDQISDSAKNIMPMLIKALQKNKPFTIYGNDYKTPDGTALRDYIHVDDLVTAHISLSKYLQHKDTGLFTYNVGLSRAVSVLELVKTFNEVNGTDIKINFSRPRDGDLPVCFADCRAIQSDLGWSAQKNLVDMCKDAYQFYNMQKIRDQ